MTNGSALSADRFALLLLATAFFPCFTAPSLALCSNERYPSEEGDQMPGPLRRQALAGLTGPSSSRAYALRWRNGAEFVTTLRGTPARWISSAN